GPAIFIEVGGDRSHSIAVAKFRYSRLLAHIGESAIAIVSIQRVISRRQAARTTFDWHSLPGAIAVRSRLRDAFEVKLKVVRDEEIQLPVAVVIKERAPRAPSRNISKQAGFFGDVCESSIAVVAIELVLSEVGDK